MAGYIYIVWTREFTRLNEPTYKIGRTARCPRKRCREYAKDSQLLYYKRVHDCKKIERLCLDKFKKKYVIRREYGTEYFSGDFELMKKTVNIIIKNNNTLLKHYGYRDENDTDGEDRWVYVTDDDNEIIEVSSDEETLSLYNDIILQDIIFEKVIKNVKKRKLAELYLEKYRPNRQNKRAKLSIFLNC